MIIMHVELKIKPEMVSLFLDVTNDLIKESKKEKGNVAYDLVKVIGSENEYKFIEIWKDEESLEFHKQTSHFIAYKNKTSHIDYFLEPIKIKFFEGVEI